MATGTGITAGNRALKARLRDRKLPSLETRAADPITQASLETLAEHLRVYEGDVRAPKERFITLKELEDAGIIKTGVKSGYAYIAQALQRDVAQKAGSTANPSLKGVIKKDTSRQSRTPGGGGGGGSATNPIEVGKSGQGAKLNDNFDVLVPSPAQREFLYYDGSKWTAYPLFRRENKWFAKQYFAGGIDAASISVDGTDIADIYVDVAGDTMTGALNLTKAAVAGVYGSTVNLYSGNPQVSIHDTGAAADEGVWNIIGGTDTLKLRTLSDDFATAVDAMTINRTGTAVDGFQFATNVQIDGDGEFLTLKNANHLYTDVLLNTYIRWQDSGGTDMAWIGHGSNSNNDLGIYHSLSGYNIRMGTVGAGDILMGLGATGALEITGSSYKTNPTGLRLGQYTSTIGYIQAPASGKIAMWTDGTGEIAAFNDDGTTTFGTGAGGLNGGVTGTYGAIQTTGSKGGYGGISLDGNFVLMNSGSAHVGLYNDINNEWMWIAYPNSFVALYYNGVDELRTQDSNATGESTGVMVKHHNQSFYDVGLNQMPRVITNASVTLGDEHAGGYMYHSNSTVYTITLNNSSPGGADFPIGSTFFVLNYGTGNITVNTGSGTLYNPQLGTGTTGSRTIGGNSVATILKYGADSWFVWGDAIS